MIKSSQTLDIAYARKVLEHLIDHPEEHYQHAYGFRTSCGTSACIAGTAVLMDPESSVRWMGSVMAYVIANGRAMDIDIRAAELLGLDYSDTQKLFLEMRNNVALEKLGDYITQAEAAQAMS